MKVNATKWKEKIKHATLGIDLYKMNVKGDVSFFHAVSKGSDAICGAVIVEIETNEENKLLTSIFESMMLELKEVESQGKMNEILQQNKTPVWCFIGKQDWVKTKEEQDEGPEEGSIIQSMQIDDDKAIIVMMPTLAQIIVSPEVKRILWQYFSRIFCTENKHLL